MKDPQMSDAAIIETMFDALTLDEARVLQSVSKLSDRGQYIWPNALPEPLSHAVERLKGRGLLAVEPSFNGADALVVTAAGFDLLASAPWWDAPWFVPDTPGWLADAWYAQNVMGMTIKITRRKSERAGTLPQVSLPYTVAAVKTRPDQEWPIITWLLGDVGPDQTPSSRGEDAVRRADDLVAAQGVEVAFLRVRRGERGFGWGCRIARGDASVTADGALLTGCFADPKLQGTVFCQAVWLAMKAGILPPFAAPID